VKKSIVSFFSDNQHTIESKNIEYFSKGS